MKKVFLSLLSLLLTITVVSKETISKENLFDFLHSKKYLKANFTQTTVVDFNERIVSGKIQASRSGNFKIEYLDPIKETISADKEFFYKLDIELEQLDIVPREEYFKNTPISILISNFENLIKLYSINSCIDENLTTLCSLSTIDENSFVKKIYLQFEGTDLVSLAYLDSFDQNVNFDFEEISWKPFSENQLHISIPKGIDVVYH